MTLPLPPPSNYGSQDPGYPAFRPGVSTSSNQNPGGEPVRIHPLAFMSVVLAFCAPVIGLIFGIIAIIQTRDPGRGGRGVAWVGTALSLVGTVAFVVLTIQFVSAGSGH